MLFPLLRWWWWWRDDAKMEVKNFKKGLIYRVILHLPFLAATVLLRIFSVCFGAKGDEKTGVESSSSLSNFVVSITTEYVQNKICSLHILNHPYWLHSRSIPQIHSSDTTARLWAYRVPTVQAVLLSGSATLIPFPLHKSQYHYS